MGTQPVSITLPAPLELGAGAKAAQAWPPLISPHTLRWHSCISPVGAVAKTNVGCGVAELLGLGVVSTGACGTGSGLPAAWGQVHGCRHS